MNDAVLAGDKRCGPEVCSPFDVLITGFHLHVHISEWKLRLLRLELRHPSKTRVRVSQTRLKGHGAEAHQGRRSITGQCGKLHPERLKRLPVVPSIPSICPQKPAPDGPAAGDWPLGSPLLLLRCPPSDLSIASCPDD